MIRYVLTTVLIKVAGGRLEKLLGNIVFDGVRNTKNMEWNVMETNEVVIELLRLLNQKKYKRIQELEAQCAAMRKVLESVRYELQKETSQRNRMV